MSLQQADIFYGTVGILAIFGVVFVVRGMDQILSPIIGEGLVGLLALPVIVWGGLTSICVTYRALKGGFREVR